MILDRHTKISSGMAVEITYETGCGMNCICRDKAESGPEKRQNSDLEMNRNALQLS